MYYIDVEILSNIILDQLDLCNCNGGKDYGEFPNGMYTVSVGISDVILPTCRVHNVQSWNILWDGMCFPNLSKLHFIFNSSKLISNSTQRVTI